MPKSFSIDPAERQAIERLIEEQLLRRDISDGAVIEAFRRVPRSYFVPQPFRPQAYEDHPINIGHDQTISQPYIVAYMMQQLDLQKSDRVLEVGTGSGYQTALLAEIVSEVYSVEFLQSLYQHAGQILKQFGRDNIHLRLGDGRLGWPEEAPFDKIIVAAASRDIPAGLIAQLMEGGKIIIPIGEQEQTLYVGQKQGDDIDRIRLTSVRFVPLM